MTFVGILIGAVWGGLLAKSRKGNALDIAQYAAGFGIAIGLVFFIVNVLILRQI